LLVIPALDISEARVVGRRPGSRSTWPVYSDDPVAVARRWQDEGATILHVADMDDPAGGEPAALPVLRAIALALSVPVEFSASLATISAAERVLDAGARWVVFRHEAMPDPALLGEAVEQLGERLIVAIAAGAHDVDAQVLARSLEAAGVARLIVRDAAADGALAGPNVAGLARIAEAVAVPILAAGGVSSLDDLARLRELEPLGVIGVIVGRALYEGRLSLPEAIAAASENR
jgi:phosphoribosylformimino-5-aminoimidazole carboxamide ribotide isomerase